MAAPIVVTAVFTPIEGAYNELVEVLSEAVAEVHQEPGCLLYAIHRHPEGQLILIEKWESVELLDLHGSSPAVERLNAGTAGLLESPVAVTRLVPIPAGTVEQGQL